ncbi:MAG: peptide deformylase [Rhodobacteraceae bacterium]|nr:peptide deformylase [Paracoccaceae bacterium]
MSVRKIRQWPDPVLMEVCAPVEGGVTPLAQDLVDTMYDAGGRGLSAPQLGDALRIFVMDAGWKEPGAARSPLIAINPKIIQMPDARVKGPEVCLSLPELEAEVARAPWVILSWTDLEGARSAKRFEGVEAVIIQHEIDHLDGRLTLGHLSDKKRRAYEKAHGG